MVSHPRHSRLRYSPSVPPNVTENSTSKGLSVDQTSNADAEQPKRKVRRYSPERLMREKLDVRAPSIVSTEKHRGRLMVRVESQDNER
jgi:hypothetical protein